MKSMQNTEQNTWQIRIILNMKETDYSVPMDPPNWLNRVRDSEVIMTIHSPKVIPSLLEAEYTPIFHCSVNNMHYTKQTTNLKTSPYYPSCEIYEVDKCKYWKNFI